MNDYRIITQLPLLSLVTLETYTRDMPEEAYKREGLAWMAESGLPIRKQHPRAFFDAWRAAAEDVYVVRFGLSHICGCNCPYTHD